MSIPRHHAEWLSLMEISGPFLSMPVLLDAFPQGLDAPDPDHARLLRAAYEEWADNQGGLAPDPAIHHAWVQFILTQTLGMPDEVLAEGQAIPEGIKATLAEHGETIRPDMMVVDPDSKEPKLLIQIYPPTQELNKAIPGRNWKAAPPTRLMELLHTTEIRLGLATNGEQWLLVQAQRGETTGYVSWYADLWLEERLTLRAFRTLLGVERFFGVPEEQTLPALLDASAKDQHEVTDQLGYQVRRAVEILIQAIDRADEDRGRVLLIGVNEARLYEAALTVMMRLVFLLTAEERGLLLLGDPIYDQYYAISTLRAQLRSQADRMGEEVLERRFDAWCRLLATFRAVYGGVWHEDLRLPAYGGSLFDPERFPFLEGRSRQDAKSQERQEEKEERPLRSSPLAASRDSEVGEGISRKDAKSKGRQEEIDKNPLRSSPLAPLRDPSPPTSDPLPINNRTVLHLLEALQILRVQVPGGGSAEARRLSFRALDIEQIGHVYEGLLDHEARRAPQPVLGLTGTKNKEPEVSLARLEEAQEKGEKELVALLREETGRTASALKNGLQAELENQEKERLRTACGNDETLYQRVLPFAGLVRDDDYGWPVVIQSGSVYVTAGATRRATGTHYTPRSLTEPIVQHTLEPLVYDGPAEGKPRAEWRLRSPKALLSLKVCDMAMGSGAFLVQACRYLSERLVEAWEGVLRQDAKSKERQGGKDKNHSHSSSLAVPRATESGEEALRQDTKSKEHQEGKELKSLRSLPLAPLRDLRITPEGTSATGDPGETILPDSDEERLVLARRLVVDRCLYGVDKNRLAVEMAKLSLWLVTLDKKRPFTFVDHALRHGDSLIGADEEMFLRWAHGLRNSSMPLFDQEIRKLVAEAKEKRQALQAFAVRDVRDAEEKARLLAEAEAATARIKRGCDLLVGARLLDDLTQSEQHALLANALIDYVAGEKWQDPAAVRAINAARALPAFHWPFEFPEVFAIGGFSAVVGNPPFMGGQKISGEFGKQYRNFIVKTLAKEKKGSADLCAFFFLRSWNCLSEGAAVGLIATNTIAQGDTRDVGLGQIKDHKNANIFRTISSQSWPGTAALEVSIVHLFKGRWQSESVLNGEAVNDINSSLTSGQEYVRPFKLEANKGISFQGPIPLGKGYVLTTKEAQELLGKDPRNHEVIFPYLTGSDFVNDPQQNPSSWVINFHDWSLEKAEQFPEVLEIIRTKVKPQRDKNRRKVRREKWWQWAERAPELFRVIEPLTKILVNIFTAKYVNFAFIDKSIVVAGPNNVFAIDTDDTFAFLQSTMHELWASEHGSTLETRQRYSNSDCFETFPFPKKLDEKLQKIGAKCYSIRADLLLDRQEGLTTAYNHFHDPKETSQDISRLREIHVEMDNAVAAAYGWQDLDLGHGFHDTPQGIRYTISEAARREVLTRLLKLNHRRYEEEVKLGLHDKKKKSTRRRKGRKKGERRMMGSCRCF